MISNLSYKVMPTTNTICEISKREVEEKDYDRITKAVKSLESLGIAAKEKLIIKFCKSENSREKIFEIDSIREYVQEIYNKLPYIIYFLSNYEQSRDFFLMCLVDKEKIKQRSDSKIHHQLNEETIRNIIDAVIDYGLSIKEEEGILWEYLDSVFIRRKKIFKSPTMSLSEVKKKLRKILGHNR